MRVSFGVAAMVATTLVFASPLSVASGSTATAPSLTKPSLKVLSAKNRCGPVKVTKDNYLIVDFKALKLQPHDLYDLQGGWPHEVDDDDGLYHFTAKSGSYRKKAAHLSPIYSSDTIPRHRLTVTFTLYNFGPKGANPSQPPMSRSVVVHVAKCS